MKDSYNEKVPFYSCPAQFTSPLPKVNRYYLYMLPEFLMQVDANVNIYSNSAAPQTPLVPKASIENTMHCILILFLLLNKLIDKIYL